MNRWIRFPALALLLALASTCQAQAFDAQAPATPPLVREAPRDVTLARMVVTLPPQVMLDGVPDRLSPGARIRDTRNLLALSGSLAGQDLPVVYRRDPAGLVHEVWLLTEGEYARLVPRRWVQADSDAPATFAERLNRVFAARP